jgi:pimeloyl-ACP methyl ester carboxylesterase
MNAATTTTLLLLAAVAAATGDPPEPGADIPEGVVHSLPGEDRSYELLVPPARRAELRDLPLVVYLHASKDPQVDRAKRDYWPLLAKRRCLLAIPTSKGEKMWLAGEEKYVADVIADVQTRYSVDAGRIILLGTSSGGQVALFLADRIPRKFRAIIAVSTNPVVIRRNRQEWFYPNRKFLKKCPYFVVNHITQGSALMYWRQVRARLQPHGASISIVPVTGKVSHYQPPPEQLGPWLDRVLAGKHPQPLADPQAAAVAKMFAPAVKALPAAIEKAEPAGAKPAAKSDGPVQLSVQVPPGFERNPDREEETDPDGRRLVQLRLDHEKWPIYLRCEARWTKEKMSAALAAEAEATRLRGMLYQVYHTGRIARGRQTWQYRIGSITYPDGRRGWVSALFIQAAAPRGKDTRRWWNILVVDETQEPDSKELAQFLTTALRSLHLERAATTRPGVHPGGS